MSNLQSRTEEELTYVLAKLTKEISCIENNNVRSEKGQQLLDNLRRKRERIRAEMSRRSERKIENYIERLVQNASHNKDRRKILQHIECLISGLAVAGRQSLAEVVWKRRQELENL